MRTDQVRGNHIYSRGKIGGENFAKYISFNDRNIPFQPSFTICVYEVQNDTFVSREIIDSGWFEPQISIFLKELLTIWPNTNTSKTVVLDVGANLGIHGLYMAKLGYRVWAIEPQEINLTKVYQ